MKTIVHIHNCFRSPARPTLDSKTIAPRVYIVHSKKQRIYIRDEESWQESKHPRDPLGEFTSGGAGSASKKDIKTTRMVKGVRVTESGEELPAHIKSLRIPPAWTDVKFDSNPKADLLVTGKDKKGRRQAVYSKEFSGKQAAAKFARISELDKKYTDIEKQNDVSRKSDDSKKRDAADCLYLIMKTGIRPGSDEDTGAEKKAYGATTLEGRHVIVDGDRVFLKFVGKKGVALDIPVQDANAAAMLIERKKVAGASGKIFPINEKTLLDHVHSLDGGGFKTKDFRTLLGTKTAMHLVEGETAPTSEKEYKKAVLRVAKAVSTRLGNTPTIALQSYINPSVFAEWKIAI